MERDKRKQDGTHSADTGDAGAGGNSLRTAKLRQRQRERKAGGPADVQRIEGDEIVFEVGTSKDDGSQAIKDVEADAAKTKLRQKVMNTKDAIFMGAERALLEQLGAEADSADEAKQEKIVGAIKDPFKEKIVEFAKGKALQAGKVKGGGAAGRAVKNKLASEGSEMMGKAAGAVAVVGVVKDVFDGIEEAELADFKATTFKGLINEINGALPGLFAGYFARVDMMTADEAVYAVAGETTDPWITSAHVASELKKLFGAMQIQASLGRGGPLKGGAVFDAVQRQIHAGEEDEK
jgi:hypothetical protein